MALAIATNNAALRAAASASGVNRDMETSMARLSSGKRINSASDDAAGVAISSRLTANIRGTDQAIRNALDGQALIDTAEGTYKEIENILQRLREISVQAANDTNDANDRRNLQAEMSALNVELDRIAEVTTWAGQNLLDGSFANKTLQIGSNTGMPNQIEVSIPASGLSDLLASESAGEADFATGGGLGAITDVKTIMGPEDTSINSSSFSVTPQAIIALDGGNFAVNAGVFLGDGITNIVQIFDSHGNALSEAIEATPSFMLLTEDGNLAISDNYTEFAVYDQSGNYLSQATLVEVLGSDSSENNETYTSGAAYQSQRRDVEGNHEVSIGAVVLVSDERGDSWNFGLSGFISDNEGINLQLDLSFEIDVSDLSLNLSTGTSSVYQDNTFVEFLTDDTFVVFTSALDANGGKILIGQAISTTGETIGEAFSIEQFAHSTISGDFFLSSFEHDFVALNENEFVLLYAGEPQELDKFADGSFQDGNNVFAKKVNINDGPAAGAFRLNSPKNLLDTSEYMAEDGSFFEYETLYDHSESTPLATQLSTGEIAVVWQNYVEDETGHSYTTIDFQVLSTEPMQISTANGARGAIEKIDNALGYVANIRSKLGAISNRLTHTVSNLTNISANLSAARGGIEDADFAFETTQLAKNQILQQASTAMLAQANASKQNVLSLLQG